MIRADLSDQTVVEDVAQKPVTATDRYKRQGHYPGIILVEGNSALASRLERALFDDHFAVLQVSAEDVPIKAFESQLTMFQSLGLVVIYSSDTVTSETKRRLSALAADRLFDLSTMQLPAEESEAVRKFLTLVNSLRAITRGRDQDKSG